MWGFDFVPKMQEEREEVVTRTSISWVKNKDGSQGYAWNVVTGCTPVSPGCRSCYAARLASTRLAHLPAYEGLTIRSRACGQSTGGKSQNAYHWTGEMRFSNERLSDPLRIRKPSAFCLNNMGDTFSWRALSLRAFMTITTHP